MRLTLCIDALGPQLAGIGRYTWELARGLAQRDDLEALYYFGRGCLIDGPQLLIEGEKLPRRRRISRPFHDWKVRRTLRSTLVHGPNYFLPALAEGGVITVHDLSVFKFPETHPQARVRAFERQFAHSLERCSHIIADTETIRREVIETFAFSPELVSAVHLGVDPRFGPAGDREREGLSFLGLEQGGYGLCVSTLEPRKKIAELIHAWEQLPGALRSRYPLVLAGGSGWENDALHESIERAAGQGWLRHLGFVEEALLPSLYAGSALFIYPSIYEGFGLPPIEAMASGTPVIVANRSCLPEVCGDAARYVEPEDLKAFSQAIEECLTDTEWRSQAILRGLVRAKEFTWDRCVDQTMTIYQKVNGSS